jgi:hypothetical protein
MTALCDLLSSLISYWMLVQEEGSEMGSEQPPNGDVRMPTAPVVANLKAAARPEGEGSDVEAPMREFYWAADVHRMLDMTNASLKDSTRAAKAAHLMTEELSMQVEELKKVNEMLNNDVATVG